MNTVEQRAIKQFELRHGVPGKDKKVPYRCLTLSYFYLSLRSFSR